MTMVMATNDTIKKAIGLLSKTTTLHMHHTFLYISLLSLHDYGVKLPNFTFYGGHKQATMVFFFLFLNLSGVLKNSTPGKFADILTFSENWNKHDKL